MHDTWLKEQPHRLYGRDDASQHSFLHSLGCAGLVCLFVPLSLQWLPPSKIAWEGRHVGWQATPPMPRLVGVEPNPGPIRNPGLAAQAHARIASEAQQANVAATTTHSAGVADVAASSSSPHKKQRGSSGTVFARDGLEDSGASASKPPSVAISTAAGAPPSAPMSAPPLPPVTEWSGDFYDTHPSPGIAIRHIPENGQCGWVAMALVFSAVMQQPASPHMVGELKKRMAAELDKNPSVYEQFVSSAEGGPGSVVEFKQRLLAAGSSYQTDHVDLALLSAVIGSKIHVISHSDRGFTIGDHLPTAQWCVLLHKGKSHYDLLYHAAASEWTPCLTEEQARSKELKRDVRAFLEHQEQLDRATRAAQERASVAAVTAMQVDQGPAGAGSAASHASPAASPRSGEASLSLSARAIATTAEVRAMRSKRRAAEINFITTPQRSKAAKKDGQEEKEAAEEVEGDANGEDEDGRDDSSQERAVDDEDADEPEEEKVSGEQQEEVEEPYEEKVAEQPSRDAASVTRKVAKSEKVKSLDSNSVHMNPSLLKQIRENFALDAEQFKALKASNSATGTLSMTTLVRKTSKLQCGSAGYLRCAHCDCSCLSCAQFLLCHVCRNASPPAFSFVCRRRSTAEVGRSWSSCRSYLLVKSQPAVFSFTNDDWWRRSSIRTGKTVCSHSRSTAWRRLRETRSPSRSRVRLGAVGARLHEMCAVAS